jgi:hypothetical protein
VQQEQLEFSFWGGEEVDGLEFELEASTFEE